MIVPDDCAKGTCLAWKETSWLAGAAVLGSGTTPDFLAPELVEIAFGEQMGESRRVLREFLSPTCVALPRAKASFSKTEFDCWRDECVQIDSQPSEKELYEEKKTESLFDCWHDECLQIDSPPSEKELYEERMTLKAAVQRHPTRLSVLPVFYSDFGIWSAAILVWLPYAPERCRQHW